MKNISENTPSTPNSVLILDPRAEPVPVGVDDGILRVGERQELIGHTAEVVAGHLLLKAGRLVRVEEVVDQIWVRPQAHSRPSTVNGILDDVHQIREITKRAVRTQADLHWIHLISKSGKDFLGFLPLRLGAGGEELLEAVVHRHAPSEYVYKRNMRSLEILLYEAGVERSVSYRQYGSVSQIDHLMARLNISDKGTGRPSGLRPRRPSIRPGAAK